MSFAELGVRDDLCRIAASECGWAGPLPVQVETIPLVLGGRDVCVLSSTGSGKTGAFGLALVQLVLEAGARPRVEASPGDAAGQRWSLDDCVAVDEARCVFSSRKPRRWGTAKSPQAADGGLSYFEVHILSEGLARVGWSAPDAASDLGRDQLGYGYGATGVKVHASEYARYGVKYGSQGDVVGCALDLDAGTISFAKNGEWMGVAFAGVSGKASHPTVCVKGATVMTVTDPDGYRFQPPGACRPLVAPDPKRRALQLAVGPTALVLEPNAQLAKQVSEMLGKLARHLPRVSVGLASKGTGAEDATAGILVGTPGKICELQDAGHLDLRGVRHIVLDEADLLASTTNKQVARLHGSAAVRPQTVLFSATLDSSAVRELSDQLQQHPEWVRLGEATVPASVRILVGVVAAATEAAPSVAVHGQRPDAPPDGVGAGPALQRKLALMYKILEAWNVSRALVYVRTREDARSVCAALGTVGLASADFSASPEALSKFREGTVQFLVACDGAERGLDVGALDYVFNLIAPETVEKFIHRVGRVGRNSRRGVAFLLVFQGREKVWYHKCARGRSTCTNADACTVWIDEMARLERIERRLPGACERVTEPDFGYGQAAPRAVAEQEYQRRLSVRASALATTSRRLANLERAAQFSYLAQLRRRTQSDDGTS